MQINFLNDRMKYIEMENKRMDLNRNIGKRVRGGTFIYKILQQYFFCFNELKP